MPICVYTHVEGGGGNSTILYNISALSTHNISVLCRHLLIIPGNTSQFSPLVLQYSVIPDPAVKFTVDSIVFLKITLLFANSNPGPNGCARRKSSSIPRHQRDAMRVGAESRQAQVRRGSVLSIPHHKSKPQRAGACTTEPSASSTM